MFKQLISRAKVDDRNLLNLLKYRFGHTLVPNASGVECGLVNDDQSLFKPPLLANGEIPIKLSILSHNFSGRPGLPVAVI